MTEEQLIEAFWQAMRNADINIEDAPEPDGELHRAYSDGDKAGSKDAWYALHINEDGTAVGFFGHWAHGEQQHQWSSREVSTLSPEQRERYKAKVEATKKARLEKKAKAHESCGAAAARMWHLGAPAKDTHPYLVKKGVKAHDIKHLAGKLLVPIRNGKGELVSLQYITHDAAKYFLPGTPKTGNYFIINGKDADILITEGYATGASCYEATGYMTIVAFDAGNLLPVAHVIRGQYPDAKIIICADNDHGKEANKGLIAGREAAAAVGGLLAFPMFTAGDKGTDFNDLHKEEGCEAVRSAIEAAHSVNDIGAPTQAKAPAITPAAQPDPQKELVKHLAALPELEYQKSRKDAAKDLGIAVTGLDKVVSLARKEEAKRLRENADNSAAGDTAAGFALQEVIPWPEPVDAAALLDEIVTIIHRYIVLPEHTAIAATLWSAFTWNIHNVSVAPIALITAPEKRCGKTQLLDLLQKLCYRPLPASNITPAALFRAVDLWQPTLLIDEADTFLKNNEELRGIINGGHTPSGAFVIRIVEVKGELIPMRFCTWGGKAMAGIGSQADTIMDRSIILELRRKLPHETAQKLRHADPKQFEIIQQKLARMAKDAAEAIALARPTPLETANDRAQDNWEPLLAIADYAGGDWPIKARKAGLLLTGVTEDTPSLSTRLLADIKKLFGEGVDRLSTDHMIKGLCDDEEAPWATLNKGFPIKPYQIAKRLAEFKIRPGTIRVTGVPGHHNTAKGYKLDQLKEAFERYLPADDVNPTQRHTATKAGHTEHTSTGTDFDDADTGEWGDALSDHAELSDDEDCDAVTDQPGGNFEL